MEFILGVAVGVLITILVIGTIVRSMWISKVESLKAQKTPATKGDEVGAYRDGVVDGYNVIIKMLGEKLKPHIITNDKNGIVIGAKNGSFLMPVARLDSRSKGEWIIYEDSVGE